MNKSYRSIWNAAKQVYVAAAETVSARGKPCSGTKISARIAVLTGGLLALTANAQTAPPPNALPTGGQVSAGQATISQNGANMVVTQGSDRAAIDWQSFNVGQNAHVQFQQPGASSVALNRVVGPDPSQIFGRITANGQVILTNPAGVYFGPSARVDVGGLIATTHSISNDDFMAGKYKFERNGSEGKVINEGELKAAIEGYVALLAPEVRNQGAIIAQMGTVALAAGEAFDLHFDSNNRLTSIRVEPSQIDTLVENRYAVKAPGGLVILSAQSMDRLIGGVVKNSGTIEANGLKEQGGRIILAASNTVENTGIVRADATDGPTLADSGPAGSIEVTAPKVVNSGTISANGSKTATAPVNRKGGNVKITATEAVVNSGTIEVTSAAAVAAVQDAGRIQVQAPRIEQTATGRLDVSGEQQGGTLTLQATGAVSLAGSLDASAKLDTDSQGGLIDVTTPGPITLMDAQLDTSGGQGGQIQLKAFATETVIKPAQPATPLPLPEDTNPGHLAILGNSSINSRGRSRNGGRVALLGDHIALNDTTRIDVTGATGGGEVLVGGDWQGGNGVYQATTVVMDDGVVIDASAIDNGDGGKVVLWSDVHNPDSVTTARGSVFARGGEYGGNGGKVETSAHTVNIEEFKVNTLAPKGQSGLWLIDPYNYNIYATQAAAISSALNTTDVTVTTYVSVPGYGSDGNPNSSGDITVNSPILKTGAADTTLTLQAHRRVLQYEIATIGSSGGKLNVVLWSDYANANTGGVTILADINTAGGHFWAGGSSTNGGSTTWNGLTVGNGASVGSTSANYNAFDLAGNITTGGGDVFIWAGAGVSGRDGIGLYGNRSISSGTGDITLLANQIYNASHNGTLTLNTTGHLTLAPGHNGAWSNTFNWAGTTSGGTFRLNNIGGLGQPVAIQNINSLGGLTIGYHQTVGRTNSIVSINADITIAGPLNVQARTLDFRNNPTLNTSGNNGDLLLEAADLGIDARNSLTSLRAGSGDITIRSDWVNVASDATKGFSVNTTGTFTFEPFNTNWTNFGTTFNLTGSLANNTFTGSSQASWLRVSNVSNLGGLTLGKVGNTSSIRTNTAWDINGPISFYGTDISIDAALKANNNTITLNATGNITQMGVLTAKDLILRGNVRLDRANLISNNTTLEAGMIGVYLNNALGLGSLTLADNTTLLLGRAVTSLANNIELLGSSTVDLDTEVEYLVVGGGGGGGNAYDGAGGGGGGAGGMLAGVISAEGGTVGVAVGDGGAGGAANSTAGVSGTNGGNSVLGSLVANGGGGGGGSRSNGLSGGSGGGGGSRWTDVRPGGFGISPQGNAGGTNSGGQHASGGGGAGSVGGSYGNNAGGTGLVSSISGVSVMYARGGVGGLYSGDRGTSNGPAAQGYGGGGGAATANYGQTAAGAAGNSGIVIARYKGPAAGTGGSVTSGSGTATGYTLHTFTNIGTHSLTLNALRPTLSGVISGAGNLKVNATDGSVTLSGANTYSGGTTLTGGVLKTTTRASALGSGAVVLNNVAGAKLDVAGDLAIGSLSGGGTTGGNVTVGNGYTLTTGALNTDTTYAGVISGTNGGLTKTGTGTFTLTANGTYSGATTINDGTLVLQNNAPTQGTSGFSGPGALRIESAADSFSGAFSTNGWSFGSDLGSLTIGRGTNTRDITVANAINIAGPISLNGGSIAINAGLSTTGDDSTISFKSTGSVTDGVSGYVSAANLLLSGGNVTLDSANNAVGTLAGSGLGSLTYIDKDALTIGRVNGVDGLAATGAMSVATKTGDMTVNKNVSTVNASAAALVLNAGLDAAARNANGGDLVINGGSLSVGSGGIAKLYSGRILGSTGLDALVGANSGNFRYSSDETTTGYTKALSAGLNAIYRERPTATVTVASKSMTYGDNLPSLSGIVKTEVLSPSDTSTIVLENPLNGDSTNYVITNRVNSTSGNINVGSYTITEDGLASLGYNVTVNTNTLTVGKKQISLTGLRAEDKVYDGHNTAAVSLGSLSGTVTKDTVSVATGYSAAFDNRNVGANKTVTLSGITLDGADKDNYAISDQQTTATITPKTLTLSAVSDTKIYDATTNSSGVVGVVGLVTGDSLTTGATQSFDSKNVQGAGGSTLRVNSGWVVGDGNSGKNYAVVTETATGTITPKALTVSGLRSENKVYDGTTYAKVNGTATLANAVKIGSGQSDDGARYDGDDVVVNGAAIGTFNSKDVASATTVAFSGLTLSGSQAGNYSLTPHASVNQTITRAALTVRPNDDAKFVTYEDPTFSVSYSGFVGGETSATAGFIGKLSVVRSDNGPDGNELGSKELAGTYTGNLTAGGLTAGNYEITYAPGNFLIVAADQLLVKVANTTSTYAGTPSYTIDSAKYLKSGDTIRTLTTTGKDATLDVNEEPLTLLVGDVLTVDGVSRRITAIEGNALTLNAAFESNLADAAFAYAREAIVTNLSVTGDKVTVDDNAGTSASFTLTPKDANKSTAEAFNVGAYQLKAADFVILAGNNFDKLALVGSLSVTQKALTASATAGVSKTYDGNTAMTGISIGLAGKETNDLVTVNGTGAFDSKNAGSNLGYTVANLQLDGKDAANYYLSGGNSFTGANGEILTREITVTYAGVDKVYDGSSNATVTTTDNRITGDNLVINRTAAFDNENVARDESKAVINKTINVTEVSLDGADKGNYTVSATGLTTAKITPASLIISGITGVDRVYDKTMVAGVNTTGLRKNGLVGTDEVVVNVTGAFADVKAANGKSVTLSSTYAGADVGNYDITDQTGTFASIFRRPVAVSASEGVQKEYDGTTDMNGVKIGLGQVGADVNSGLIDGDNLTVSGTGSFSTANAGTGKDYTLSGLQLGGTDVANYTIAGGVTSVSGKDGVITPKTITATGISAVNKVYDGTVNAELTGGSLIGVVGSDEVTLSGQTGVFRDKNVGTDKEVNITNIGLAGAAKGNYVLADASKTATSSANITRLDSVTWIGGNSGNWFDPTKWAVTGNLSAIGVVPDLANVSNVVLQKGGTVTFADTDSGRSGLAQTGTVQIDGLTGASANLVMSDGAIQIGTGGATLAGLAQTGGEISSTGDVTVNGSFSQSDGTLTTSGTDADISITQTSGDLSWKSMTSGGNLTLSSPGKTVFGLTTVGGNLVSITQGAEAAGGVSQAAGTSLNVSGTSTFTADTGVNQIASLNAAANNFTGAVSFGGANSGRWKDLTLVDGSGGLKLGNITADGTLNLKSTDGAIDQEEDTAVNITGATTLEASNGATPATTYDINLGKANDFQGDVTVVNGNNVTLNDTNGLGFGNVTTTGGFNATAVTGDVILKADVNAGSVSLEATTGNIIQGTTGTLTVTTGPTDLKAGNDITLDNANDFNGAVNIDSAKNVALNDTTGLELGNVTTTGNLQAKAAEDLTLSATTTVGGKLDATAGEDLTLNGAIKAASADLEATTGNISQGTNGTLTVTSGPTDLKAGTDITLDKANDFNGAVNIESAKNIVLNDSNGLELGNVTTTGNLQAKAAEDLTLNGTTTVGGKLDATAGEDLTLNGAINAASADLEATTGNISQGTNGTLTVTSGPTDLKAGNDITLDKANDFNGAVNIDSAKNVALNDTTGLELGNVTTTGNLEAKAAEDLSMNGTTTVGGKLDATAGTNLAMNGAINAASADLEATSGGISQGANSTVTVTNGPTDLKAQNAITLDKRNDFNGAVNAQGNNVTLNDVNDMTLGNITSTGTFSADVGGTLGQGANSTVLVDGQSTLKAGSDINLNSATNDFKGAVNAEGGSITLTDSNILVLGNTVATTNLNLTSNGLLNVGTTRVGGNLVALTNNGDIIQQGALFVGGNATLNAGTGRITLNNPGNDLRGMLTVTASSSDITGSAGKGAGKTQEQVLSTLPTTPQPGLPGSALGTSTPPAPLTLNQTAASATPSTSATTSTGIVVKQEAAPAADGSTVVSVAVPVESAAPGSSFKFELPESVRDLAQGTALPRASMSNGAPLPSWLSFDGANMSFEASAVPPGVLPIEVVVTIGDQSVLVLISTIAET